MARQKTILIDLVNVDADGIAVAQSVAAAGSLTLAGALTSGGVYTADWPRQISITSDGNDSGRTFAVTGTSPDGAAQTESITGPNTTTVESSSYWKTVTSIAVDDACAGNISAGIVDEAVTNTIPLNKYNSDPATVSIENVTGAFIVKIEETFTDIQNQSTIEWFEVATINSAAANTDLSNHATAVRLKVVSYTNGADFTFVINQNRL